MATSKLMADWYEPRNGWPTLPRLASFATPVLAEDAAQEAYLRAYRRLADLDEPAAFAGWLRRIVITVAINMRRSRRRTLLRLDDIPEVPVLDEAETAGRTCSGSGWLGPSLS